jgi:hypothetical protein
MPSKADATVKKRQEEFIDSRPNHKEVTSLQEGGNKAENSAPISVSRAMQILLRSRF